MMKERNLAICVIVAVCAVFSAIGARAETLRELTGAHARVVWARDSGDGTDVWSERDKVMLMGYDTDDGRGVRVIAEAGHHHCPLFTPDGGRVVFTHTREAAVYVVDFDGGNLRRVARDGTALDVWRDPADGRVWVYCLTQRDGGKAVRRIPLEGDSGRSCLDGELVWDRTKIDKHSFQLSADGKRAAALLPWPNAHIAELPNIGSEQFGGGCWTSMAPDNSYLAWVFDGAHRGVNLRGRGGLSHHVDIHSAPGIDNWEVYHPRWSNHPRFMTMTGPYKKGGMGGNNIGAGGKGVEVYVGRFDGKYENIEAWARITDDEEADFIPDVWVEGGEKATVAETLGEAERRLLESLETPKDLGERWPGSQQALVYLWEGVLRQNQIKDDVLGTDKSCRATLHGRAVPAAGGAVALAGGSLVAEDADEDVLKACRASGQMALEAVFETASLDQRGPARIVSFSTDTGSRNFTLGQENDELVFRLRTPATGGNGVNPQSTLCKIEPGVRCHLVVSYADGDLRAYVDGRQVFESGNVRGDFSNWEKHRLLCGDEADGTRDWSGTLAAFAVYARAVGPEEAAKKYEQWKAREAKLPARSRVVVEATLATRPEPPAPDSLGTYRRALSVCEYDLVKVVEGECEDADGRIAVAHWSVLDGRIDEEYGKREIGKTVRLELTPFEECGELEGERRFDELSDPTMPMYY